MIKLKAFLYVLPNKVIYLANLHIFFDLFPFVSWKYILPTGLFWILNKVQNARQLPTCSIEGLHNVSVIVFRPFYCSGFVREHCCVFLICAHEAVGFGHYDNSLSNSKDTTTHRIVILLTQTNVECLTHLTSNKIYVSQ